MICTFLEISVIPKIQKKSFLITINQQHLLSNITLLELDERGKAIEKVAISDENTLIKEQTIVCIIGILYKLLFR